MSAAGKWVVSSELSASAQGCWISPAGGERWTAATDGRWMMRSGWTGRAKRSGVGEPAVCLFPNRRALPKEDAH